MLETREEICGSLTNILQEDLGTCDLKNYFTTCFLLRDLTERTHTGKLKPRVGAAGHRIAEA